MVKLEGTLLYPCREVARGNCRAARKGYVTIKPIALDDNSNPRGLTTARMTQKLPLVDARDSGPRLRVIVNTSPISFLELERGTN